jgi:D-amino-acid oxidase
LRVIVIGCGVSGLSSGIRLLERGHDVRIWARDLPPNTTSNIAAAIWHPYKVFPQELALAWGRRGFESLAALASSAPESGVSLVEALEVYGEPVSDPWWRECVREFRRATPAELGPENADGFVFGTILVETGIYMEYLVRRFREHGGEIEQRRVDSLDEPLGECEVVVNCSGLGSRQLVGDDRVYPIRGQIVRTERLPIDRVILDEDESRGVTYIVPRSTDCILGGTAQPGNWSLEPDMVTAEAIMERCARLAPEVRGARVLEHLVGLRPGRDALRLEAERRGKGLVVHNYGHGGAGITLSWGCADDVADLVDRRAL